jgi:hypothetical protein
MEAKIALFRVINRIANRTNRTVAGFMERMAVGAGFKHFT